MAVAVVDIFVVAIVIDRYYRWDRDWETRSFY